ncbi:MAG TPA: hydroxysqualene dehydroxylase HpnE [Blastocatellia bacterium]|nr:hydroxysqualene dehydroxylase HpnE [Blastocatellia bacterium]
MKRIAIIGGGFAGLAAGVRLSERGFEVTLLERRNHLGGRAYSFTDAKTGDTVDNGQHLFMGCYRNTIQFLEKIGCLDRLAFQDAPRVDFVDRTNGYTTFECPRLPAPIHVLVGLFRMKGLTFRDKLRALNVGRAIQINGNPKTESLTVSDWLNQLRQSDRIKERFWYPMAIATLNEDPEVASARMMKVVLKEAFGADRKSSSIGIARVGLSDLYTTGASAFIEAHGGKVRTAAAVRELIFNGGSIVAAELKGGERIEADYFISAAPPNALLQMLPRELRAKEFAQLARLGSSPIVSINLWFDRPVINREFVGLIGTRSQWVFNKDLIFKTGRQSNQIAVVISAARGFVEWTKDELVEMAIAELRQLIPESRNANLLHSAIVKEREATLAHTIESDSLRPGPRTTIPNLILAGDWTKTGLPATIESAVLSGNIAADCLALKPE